MSQYTNTAKSNPLSFLSAYYMVVTSTAMVRGAIIVALAWTAFVATDSTAFVGLTFLTVHLTSLVLGPSIGALIDRSDRKTLVIISQCVIALAFAIATFFPLLGLSPSALKGALICVAVAVAVGPLLLQGSLDAIQQTIVQPGDRRSVSATAGGLRQAGMMVGGGGVGALFSILPSFSALLSITACALLSAAVVARLPSVRQPLSHKETFLKSIYVGILELYKTPRLARLGILSALGFSVGQTANVVLPPIVKYELQGSSLMYGVIDALWSLGGILAAFAFAKMLRRLTAMKIEYIAGITLAALTATASFWSGPYAVSMLFFLLGASFSATRVACDGLLQEYCPPELIGRMRTHYQTLISAFGILAYGLPSLNAYSSASSWFALWGVLSLLGTIGLWMWDASDRSEKRSLIHRGKTNDL